MARPRLTGVLNQLPQVPGRKLCGRGGISNRYFSGLISLNFSIKPLTGKRSRKQVTTPITSGCVHNEDQSDRSVTTERPIHQARKPLPVTWQCLLSVSGYGVSSRRREEPVLSQACRGSLLSLYFPVLGSRWKSCPSVLLCLPTHCIQNL